MKWLCVVIVLVGLLHESLADGGDHAQRGQGFGQRQGQARRGKQVRQRPQPIQEQPIFQEDFQGDDQQGFPSFPVEQQEQQETFEDDAPILSQPRGQAIPSQQQQQQFAPQPQRQGRRGGRQFSSGGGDAPFRGNVPDENGNYNFEFQTDDGSSRKETGSVKQVGNEEANEITGEYSWTSPEGELITLNYIANENGFQPTGSHIPQNVQPLHPALQRGLDLIARVNGGN